MALVHLIPTCFVWAEIECMVHVAPPKWPIKQFKPVQQSRQQALKVYCPKIYTVTPGVAHDCWIQYQWKTVKKYCWECTYSSHVFTNPEFSIYNCLFWGKCLFYTQTKKKCGGLGLNGVQLKWIIGTNSNWKNQNPGSHFKATCKTALPIQPVYCKNGPNGLNWLVHFSW